MEDLTVKGRAIPRIGLGTYRLTGPEGQAAIAQALALGYRHLDTARMYGNEVEVGRALRAAAVPREAVHVTTKLAVGPLTRDWVRDSARASLRDLGLDHVDLLLVHWPDPDTPLEETLAALTELVEEGVTAAVGVSNFPPSWVRRATALADILVNQVEYHPFLGQEALLAEAERDGHALTAYSPVARGRVEEDPTLQAIAAEVGRTPGQVALRWLVQQPRVLAIPRSANSARLRDNLAVGEFALDEEQMARISALDRGLRLIQGGRVDWER